jgi:selenocysteine lyase/cysteine desulfurase
MIEAGIDYLAFSGHKLYAPFGSGALVIRRRLLNCQPAELARIKASGEENVVGITALGKAITLLQRVGMDVLEEVERSLTRRTLRGLSRIPGIEVFGVPDPDAPRFDYRGGTIVFSAKRIPHNLVAKELREKVGIGVRNGCFCAHSIVRELLNILPVRRFIGALGLKLFPEYFLPILPGAVRVSLGLENEERHVDALIQTLEEIASAPRTRVDRFVASTHNGTPSLPHTDAENRIMDIVSARAERVFAFSS